MVWAGMLNFQHPRLKICRSISVPPVMCSSRPAMVCCLAWECYPFGLSMFLQKHNTKPRIFCWTLNWMPFSVQIIALWDDQSRCWLLLESFSYRPMRMSWHCSRNSSQRPVQWMLLTLLTLRLIFSYSRLPKVLSSLNATFHNPWTWTMLAGCRFWTILTFVCSDPPPTKGLASVGKKSLIRAI